MDSRKKGCPNASCEMSRKKHKFSMKDAYCSKCGTELVLVCKKCFKRLDDQGPEHTICAHCAGKKEALKVKAEKTAGAVMAAPVLIVGAVKYVIDNKSQIVDTGKELLDAAKNIIPK